jgi:hypothetical protein
MSEKAKVAVPVVVATLAIVVALGAVDDEIIVELGKAPTAYSDDHARIPAGEGASREPPPAF